jgi:hypothetical protein
LTFLDEAEMRAKYDANMAEVLLSIIECIPLHWRAAIHSKVREPFLPNDGLWKEHHMCYVLALLISYIILHNVFTVKYRQYSSLSISRMQRSQTYPEFLSLSPKLSLSMLSLDTKVRGFGSWSGVWTLDIVAEDIKTKFQWSGLLLSVKFEVLVWVWVYGSGAFHDLHLALFL